MREGELSDLPNPFAMPRRRLNPNGRKPLSTALRFFALVAIGFCVTLVAGSQSRRWLVHRLTSGFETLTSTEKKERLVKLSELGSLGVDPLVRSLADDSDDVARTAYELLQRLQNEWTTLSPEEISRRHLAMIDSLREVAVHVPDDRTGWASGLLQQTMMQSVDREDEASRELYGKANESLELFSLAGRPGPSVLQDGPFDPRVPQRLSVRPKPLPVSKSETAETWTDWPPEQQDAVEADGQPPTIIATDPPTLYRSSLSPLQTVPTGEAVMLRDLDQPNETSFQTPEFRPVTHLVESPMNTFDDRSVVHWLGSPHQVLREKARLELIRRGYDGGQIALATQIAAGDVTTRIGLVDVIARSDTIDPRPWLLFLLDDEHREVKLRAISVLATMNDPAITAELRTRLVNQSDPIVAARLRRILDLR